jgi:hypothetical protein
MSIDILTGFGGLQMNTAKILVLISPAPVGNPAGRGRPVSLVCG